MTPARWFSIRRDRDGYTITYSGENAELTGTYRTTDLTDACDLTVALRRMNYSEVM